MSQAAPDAPVEEPTKDASAAPEKPAEPETVTLPKAEADDLRRRVAESERAAKRLEDAAKKAKEDQAAEQGKWQELAQQREQELATERGQRETAERNARVSRLATKAKFLDPADVVGRITPEDATDDASAEAALARIAEQSPHLIAKTPPAVPEIGQVLTPSATPDAGPTPPPGKAPLRTQADVEALSDKEFQDRYQEVQAVLRSTQQ